MSLYHREPPWGEPPVADLVACFWEDLNPAAGGTVRYKTVGAGTDRALVVEFNAVPHHSSTSANTFQMRLEENGDAQCMLQSVTSDGDGLRTAVGIEDSIGSGGVRYRYGEFAMSNTAVRFGLRVQPFAPVERGPNGASFDPSISADGRLVAFSSLASNLVSGDTNSTFDIFVHDRVSGATTRESVGSLATQANGASEQPSISPDGRYVAFHSTASNLAVGDTNGVADVFVHDRTLGTTTRVSVDSVGVQASAGSYSPSISFDGRYVAFHSSATNLVAGDTNGYDDVFVKEQASGTTTRVSLGYFGKQGIGHSRYPSISGNGNIVAFESFGKLEGWSTRSEIYYYTRGIDGVGWASLGTTSYTGGSYGASASGDGGRIAFASTSPLLADDNNGTTDVYVYELGRMALHSEFYSLGLGPANGRSDVPSLSSDGDVLAFTSAATNLVPVDANKVSDIFAHTYLDTARERSFIVRVSEPDPPEPKKEPKPKPIAANIFCNEATGTYHVGPVPFSPLAIDTHIACSDDEDEQMEAIIVYREVGGKITAANEWTNPQVPPSAFKPDPTVSMFEALSLPGVKQFIVPFPVAVDSSGRHGVLVAAPECTADYTPQIAPGHWDIICAPAAATADRLSAVAKVLKAEGMIPCNPRYDFAALGQTCKGAQFGEID